MTADPTPAADPIGWWFPGAARKAHWFQADGRSLCGKSMTIGKGDGDFKVGDKPGRDDCVDCWRKAPRGDDQ